MARWNRNADPADRSLVDIALSAIRRQQHDGIIGAWCSGVATATVEGFMHMRMRATSFLALAACSLMPAHGYSSRVDIGAMTKTADVVALVELEAGELVAGVDGRRCGAAYRARVKRALKGVQVDSQIAFGRSVGQKLGSQYFVFLTNAGSPKDTSYLGLKLSTHASKVPEEMLNCEPKLPALRVMSDGYGSISVESGKLVNYRPAVRLSNGPYLLPANIPGVREPGGQVFDDEYMGTVELELDDFERYLRGFLPPPKSPAVLD